jgi:hypothetical protein
MMDNGCAECFVLLRMAGKTFLSLTREQLSVDQKSLQPDKARRE